MIFSRLKQIWIISIILFLSFTSENDMLLKIDLSNAITGDIPMSRIFEDDIEYVRLETTKECLLNNPTVFATKDYIIAINAFNGAHLFDRKTGKFIQEISRRGQGPEEYGFIPNTFHEKENAICFDDFNKWKLIDIQSNKLISTIKNPGFNEKYVKENKYKNINGFQIIDNNLFIGYTNNVTGNCPYELLIFNKEGDVIKEFPNYIHYDKKGMDNPFNTGVFYEFDKNLYFKNPEYNDTIFRITENELIPHVVFILGDNKPTPHSKEKRINDIIVAEGNPNGWYISSVKESIKHILFKCVIRGSSYAKDFSHFVGLYDKNEKQIYLSNNKKNSGFINDIDNLPDFYPHSQNSEGELIGIIKIENLIDFLDKYKNMRKMNNDVDLSNIQEDDNPIVVITKLKY